MRKRPRRLKHLPWVAALVASCHGAPVSDHLTIDAQTAAKNIVTREGTQLVLYTCPNDLVPPNPSCTRVQTYETAAMTAFLQKKYQAAASSALARASAAAASERQRLPEIQTLDSRRTLLQKTLSSISGERSRLEDKFAENENELQELLLRRMDVLAQVAAIRDRLAADPTNESLRQMLAGLEQESAALDTRKQQLEAAAADLKGRLASARLNEVSLPKRIAMLERLLADLRATAPTTSTSAATWRGEALWQRQLHDAVPATLDTLAAPDALFKLEAQSPQQADILRDLYLEIGKTN